MVNGRRKGASFERTIAADLRGWLDELDGYWSVMRAQTDRQAGQDPDFAGEFVVQSVSHPHLRFQWAIECKAAKTWHESQLWTAPVSGPITSTAKRRGYWQQAVDQASAVQLTPVLIVKRNRGPVLAIMERKTWQALEVWALPVLRFVLPLNGERWDLVAVPWSTVLTANPSNAIKEK